MYEKSNNHFPVLNDLHKNDIQKMFFLKTFIQYKLLPELEDLKVHVKLSFYEAFH